MGPYRWHGANRVRLSLADRGLTSGSTVARDVCPRFREPVRGLDPLGLLRYPRLDEAGRGTRPTRRHRASPHGHARRALIVRISCSSVVAVRDPLARLRLSPARRTQLEPLMGARDQYRLGPAPLM